MSLNRPTIHRIVVVSHSSCVYQFRVGFVLGGSDTLDLRSFSVRMVIRTPRSQVSQWLRSNPFFGYGLPFLLFMTGGFYGLERVMQGRLDVAEERRRRERVLTAEAERHHGGHRDTPAYDIVRDAEESARKAAEQDYEIVPFPRFNASPK
mmetsp:Transcript_4385/g.8643  ORF Transcript_4385/g.8643 Transcript_4385/m.8643 type:complete len:150 (-) Transcript_4385:722-1171(-)